MNYMSIPSDLTNLCSWYSDFICFCHGKYLTFTSAGVVIYFLSIWYQFEDNVCVCACVCRRVVFVCLSAYVCCRYIEDIQKLRTKINREKKQKL